MLKQCFDCGETRDDAECAVEPAAAPHGIDVGAGNDRFATVPGSTPDISDGVAAGFEAAIFQPPFNEIARGGPGGAVQRAVGPAVRLRADRVELVEPALEQRAVNAHSTYP